MDDFLYDHECIISTYSTEIVDGSEQKKLTEMYSNVPCAIWTIANTNNMIDGKISRQSDLASHKFNVS